MGVPNMIGIGIAGPIGSGKTTLARELASSLNCPRASFGDYVRFVALKMELDVSSRSVLQQVGDTLIESGWEQFCIDLLKHSNWNVTHPIIIEGIRHIKAVETLSTVMSPCPIVMVYIGTDHSLRLQRILQRGDMKDTDLHTAETHSTEQDIMNDSLMLASDIVLDGTRSVDVLVNDVLSYLNKLNILPV